MRFPEKSSSSSGFTLIEMALVLVIIGLIIGAILKGQDLINSARAKRMSAWARSAETAQWAHLDRYGRFNGTAKDLASQMDTLKNATLNMGGYKLELSFVGRNRTMHINSTAGSSDDVATWYQSFDTSIDGESSPDDGSVFCNSTGPSPGSSAGSDWSSCQILQYNFATTKQRGD